MAPEDQTPEQVTEQVATEQPTSTADQLNRILELRQPVQEDGAEPLDPMQEFIIKQQTRNQLLDIDEILKEKLPDATRSQRMTFAEAFLRQDAGGVTQAILDAHKLAIEKETKDNVKDEVQLHVEGPTTGTVPANEEKPKSLQDGVNRAVASIFKK